MQIVRQKLHQSYSVFGFGCIQQKIVYKMTKKCSERIIGKDCPENKSFLFKLEEVLIAITGVRISALRLKFLMHELETSPLEKNIMLMLTNRKIFLWRNCFFALYITETFIFRRLRPWLLVLTDCLSCNDWKLFTQCRERERKERDVCAGNMVDGKRKMIFQTLIFGSSVTKMLHSCKRGFAWWHHGWFIRRSWPLKAF